LSLSAQVIINEVDINTEKGTEYCEIVGYGKLLSAKMVIYVDYGQKRKFMTNPKKFYIRDKEGKKIIFYSMIQGLNFMYANGWEFVHCYVATTSKGNVYHYLLKRKKT